MHFLKWIDVPDWLLSACDVVFVLLLLQFFLATRSDAAIWNYCTNRQWFLIGQAGQRSAFSGDLVTRFKQHICVVSANSIHFSRYLRICFALPTNGCIMFANIALRRLPNVGNWPPAFKSICEKVSSAWSNHSSKSSHGSTAARRFLPLVGVLFWLAQDATAAVG